MKTARALSVPTSPGLAVVLALLVGSVLALELVVSASTRIGVEVTPVAWLGLGAVSLGLASLGKLRVPKLDAASDRRNPETGGLDVIDAAFNAWKSTAEVLDARITFPEFLQPAHKARLAIFPSGTTFLAARFASPEAALDAADGYRDFFGMADNSGSLHSAWSGARSQTRDFASVRCQGDMLLACTTRERAHLDPRLVLSIASASSVVRF